jgi:DNA primase
MTLQQRINEITHDGIVWLSLKAWRNITNTISHDEAIKTIIDLLLYIPAQVRRDAYTKTVCDAINKLNLAGDDKLKQLRKQLSALQREQLKAKDDEQKEIRARIDLVYTEIETIENAKLPAISIKEISKYVKDAAAEKVKEKKEKQKSIFDAGGDGEQVDIDDADDPWGKCPKFIDVEQVKTKGFSEVTQYDGGEVKRYGYYTYDPNEKSHKEVMNFTIKPIFMIYIGRETRFMIEINNGYKKAYMDLNSKCMISSEMMACEVVSQGNFIIYGSKNQFLRVSSHLLQNFLECTEVKTLGWQPSGFYAMVDRLIVPQPDNINCQINLLDEWGVSKVEKENYIVAAASLVYKKLAKGADDPFENDRPLQWIEAGLSFSEWVRRMHRVYGDKGIVGVAYAVLTVFRDIAYSIDNNFPHLYGYGDMSSGKSKWGESIAAFFYHKRPAFNLNSGTDPAFFGYMGKFRNGISLLNEFDEKVIKDEWFQSIKGVFDGESRQRMNMKDRSKIETQKVESSLLLMGQFLVTKDDNSVVSRSLIEAFSQQSRTEADVAEYIALKEFEQQGITSLISEVLRYRKYVQAHYQDAFNATLSEWRKVHPVGGNFNQRIMQNWCHLYTALNLISQHISLPINIAEFKQYCYTRGSYWCNFIRSTDTLSEFWNTVAFLVDQGLIRYGWDFVIKEESSITVRPGTDTIVKDLGAPTKVLYMRLNNVHKLYEAAFRSRTGNQGMTLNSLMHYSSSRQYYLGAVKSYRFARIVYDERMEQAPGPFAGDNQQVKGEKREQSINTSCHAFIYADLNIDIEREMPVVIPRSEADDFPFGRGNDNF